MASTGAVVYVRLQSLAGTLAQRAGGAVVFFPLRAVSGIFTTGGQFDNTSGLSNKAWLPPPRQPIGRVQPDGTVLMDPSWYNFLRYIVYDVLGGPTAPKLADVQTTVAAVQEAVTETVATVSEVTELAVANATALATTVEVVQNAALPGSTQIPPIQTAPRALF